MKSKLTLLTVLFPLLILTACNDNDKEPVNPTNQGKVRTFKNGTQLPKFMETPKPNGSTENAKP